MNDNQQQCPFWLVWNPSGYPPRYKHDTEASASVEARRLASENPGREFYVLRPTSKVIRADLLVTCFNAPPPHNCDDIPF